MEELKTRIHKILEKFNIEEKKKKIQELEAKSSESSFWQNHVEAAKKMKEIRSLSNSENTSR